MREPNPPAITHNSLIMSNFQTYNASCIKIAGACASALRMSADLMKNDEIREKYFVAIASAVKREATELQNLVSGMTEQLEFSEFERERMAEELAHAKEELKAARLAIAELKQEPSKA